MMLIELIKEKLSLPLPGIDAQMRMAPPIRHRDMQAPDDVRLGGVMILLYHVDEQWNTLLIRRTEDGHTHSGQISFPGGKKDSSDPDLLYTAIRECEEEIGVRRQDIEILGSLTPVYIPPSNFLVTPVVGFIKSLQSYKASEQEVEEIIQVPLDVLFHPENKKEHEVFRSDRKDLGMKTPVYHLDPSIIVWGATAMMIAELEAVLGNVE
ncbi:MAG: CoA pyrophosphatase [Chitinophagaceae bacterium]|nr:CoA pyrophosphatase [Chitinophagaceae bacterium]